MPAAKPELRAECIRLRVQKRKSLREIAALTGASKGALSTWLKPFPLTHGEKLGRMVLPPPRSSVDREPESVLHKIAKASKLSSLQVAKVSETAVLLRLLAHGFTPFGSPFDGDRADWVVEVPETGRFCKLQVKTMQRLKHGRPLASIRHRHNRRGGALRYKEGDFDFLVGFDLFADSCYVWSWEELVDLKTMVAACSKAWERWDKLRGVA